MKNISPEISKRGRRLSIFKMIGAIIHSKICYLSLTKEIQSFFVRSSKLFKQLFKTKPIKE